MNLTIPTPEGPFDSIVFLGDRMDWPAWLDDVTAIANAFGIWKYVDPDAHYDLSEPIQPSSPIRPNLRYDVKREQFERDQTFDLRLDRERHVHALTLLEYDTLCEQFRMDTAQYLSQLADYNLEKANLQKLSRIIYRSIPNRYRAYLKLDDAKHPRAMIASLRSKISPLSDNDRASMALRAYNSRLSVQFEDDKQEFIDAIALATVELHRLMGDRFDEDTAVKDLLRSLQVLDKEFATTWTPKERKKAVLDIVEDFKVKLRLENCKGSAHDYRVIALLDKKLTSEQQPAKEPALTAKVNGYRNGHEEPSANVLDASPKLSGKKDEKESGAKEAGLVEQSEWANKTREDPSPVEASSKPKGEVVDAPSPIEGSPSPRFKTSVQPKSDAKGSQGVKSKKGGVNGAPPTGPLADKFASKGKEFTDHINLVKKNCPGCELRHLVRGDAWWENCFVYWELSGLGNVPSHFVVRERELDLVFSRLQDCPDEMRRSEEWASSKDGRTQKKNGACGKVDQIPAAPTGNDKRTSKSKSKKTGVQRVKEPQSQTQPQPQTKLQPQPQPEDPAPAPASAQTRSEEFGLW